MKENHAPFLWKFWIQNNGPLIEKIDAGVSSMRWKMPHTLYLVLYLVRFWVKACPFDGFAMWVLLITSNWAYSQMPTNKNIALSTNKSVCSFLQKMHSYLLIASPLVFFPSNSLWKLKSPTIRWNTDIKLYNFIFE